MAQSPFTYQFGSNQGRLQPTTRAVSPLDNPGPAVVLSLQSQPFGMVDLDNLLISIGGAPTTQVIFAEASFADISAATAAEVAAVIQTQLTGLVTVVDVGGRVQITTVAIGLTASIKISGGLAQNSIQFPTDLVRGTQGVWTFVLGQEIEGQTWEFQAGDKIEITQTALFNDAKILRLRGLARWRGSTATPAGYEWRFEVGPISGDTLTFADPQIATPLEFSIDDMAINLTGLAAVPTAVPYRLILTDTGGGAGVDVTTALPGIFLDLMEFDEFASDMELANRFPAPGEIAVQDTTSTADLMILNTTAVAIDLAETTITIEGQIAFQAGVFVVPFGAGVVTTALGPSGRDTKFEIPLAPLLPFSSEQEIDITVISETAGAASTLEDSYSFFMEDTTQPALVSAQARDKTTVRVQFSEPMLMDATTNGALNLVNYAFAPLVTPAVTVIPTAAVEVTSSSVDVTLDIELTLSALYRVTTSSIHDNQGNAITTGADTATFNAFRPDQPPGRSFQLFDRIPQKNRREDAQIPSEPLKKFVLVLQDVVDLLLCDIDRWTDIIDIDLAPESFLNAILRDLGNPFAFELDLLMKRRLARILVDIYKEKGTEPGILNAIRFFTGVDVTLDILNCRSYWKIGVNFLGVDTLIGPAAGSPLWYSFFIVSPVTLTQEQRDQMLEIARYMKPAHEHILGIKEPGGVVTPTNFWKIGVDKLGATTVLA